MAASLFQTAGSLRKYIAGFLVFVVIYLLITAIIGLFAGDPLPPAPEFRRFYMNPTTIFGPILPEPKIPSIEYNRNATFFLNGTHTITFPDAAYVYSIERPRQSALSFQKAEEVVNYLGFNSENPISSEDSIFVWQNPEATKTITYDRRNRIWDITTDLAADFAAQRAFIGFTQTNEYERSFETVIEDLGFDQFQGLAGNTGIFTGQFVDLLADGTIEVTFLSSNADFAYLNLFRQLRLADLKPRDQLPVLEVGETLPEPVDARVFRNTPTHGQIRMMVSNDLRNPSQDIFRLEFREYEFGPASAYLIVTPDEAWTRVQNGLGSLVSLISPRDDEFDLPPTAEITRFSANPFSTQLAYWEPDNWKEVTTYSRNNDAIGVALVYPIYVFRGEAELSDGTTAEFIIFVNAVKDL